MNNLDDEHRSLVKRWVASNIDKLSREDPISIHLDELLRVSVYTPHTIPISVATKVFIDLVDEVREMSDAVQAILTIPLRMGAISLTMDAPRTTFDIETERDDLEPPCLYLLDWNARKYIVVTEEYRMPIDRNLLGVGRTDVYVYYREFRFPLDDESRFEFGDIPRDPEFNRCIYLEHYPYRFH